MPDFHVEMNRIGTLIAGTRIQPTEDYPEPWSLDSIMDEFWNKTTALIKNWKKENESISMVIQASDMCTAIKTLDERRKYDIVVGIL